VSQRNDSFYGINEPRFEGRLNYVTAFLISALAPAITLAALARSIEIVPLAFAMAMLHALVLGLPLLLIFKSTRWVNFISCTCMGAVIGALPVAVLTWPMGFWRNLKQSTVNGLPTVVDGLPTAAGWSYYFQTVLYLALLGALAGTAFWIALKITGETDRRKRSRALRTSDH